MNKLTLGAVAAALTVGATMAAGAAAAQPYGYHRYDAPRYHDGGYGYDRGYQRGYARYRDSDRDGIPDRREWNRDRDRDGRPDQWDRYDNRRRYHYGQRYDRYDRYDRYNRYRGW